MKYKKVLIVVSLVLTLLIVAGAFVVQYATKNILAFSSICPHRVDLNKYKSVNPGKIGFNYDTVSIVVEDTIILKGWFVHAKQKHSLGSVLFLHGIADSKYSQLGRIQQLCNNGFNCIIFDHRAHGESGGKYCTFGYYEKYDYSKILDSIISRFSDSGPYGVWGCSLGAAIAIQTMAIDNRFQCGVVESCFADFRQTAHDYAEKITHIPLSFVSDMALEESEKIAHFQVDSISPRMSALKISNPVLVIHGLNDSNISSDYGKRVFDNIKCPVKEWYPLPEATHNNIIQVGGVEYVSRVVDFFTTNMR